MNSIKRLMKDKILIEDKHMYCLDVINVIDNARESGDFLNYCCEDCTTLR